MYLLGLDVGTTGCKAILIDSGGDVKGFAYHEYHIETDSSGKAEQDAEKVWSFAKEVIRGALNETGKNPRTFSRIGFGTG